MQAPAEQLPAKVETKPFLAHLEDLRVMLIRCAVALFTGILVAMPATPFIFGMLKKPLLYVTDKPETFLRSIEVGGAFSISMQIAFWGGLLLSSPFLLLFIGAFIFPGLTHREKRAILNASGFAVLLFVFGVFLGYRFTLPAALQMMFGMHTWLGIKAEWTVTSYVAFATQLLIGFGLVFELPAILLMLARLGIIKAAQMQLARPYAIVAALIVGAVLTPPDVFSQLLMAVPLILLYEMSVWIAWFWERRKKPVA
jgi:sec-independent protein translocase protein TatC